MDDPYPQPGEAESLPPAVPMARPIFAAPAISFSDAPESRPRVMPMPMRRLHAIGELLLLIPAGILGAALVLVIAHATHMKDPRWLNLFTSFGMGLVCLLVVLILLRVDGHSGKTIGWRTDRLSSDAAVGLAAYVVTMIAATLLLLEISTLFPNLLRGERTAEEAIKETFPKMKLAWMLPMMAFVAVWEEVVFRGFLLTRLHAVLKRWWLAVLVGAGVFGLAHSYEGPLAMLLIAGLAFILSILLLWRKSLVPGIVFHFLHNVIMLMLLRLSTE